MAASVRTITTRAAQLLRTPTPRVSFLSTPVARRNIAIGTFTPRRPPPSVPRNIRSASTSSGGSSNAGLYATTLVLGTVIGGAYYLHSTGQLTDYFPFLAGTLSGPSSQNITIKGPDYKPTFEDYQEVYNEVAELLESDSDYDDGSFGPVCALILPHVNTDFHSRFYFRFCFDWPGMHPELTIKTQKLEAAMVPP